MMFPDIYIIVRANGWPLRQFAKNMADAQNAKDGRQVSLSPNVFVGDCGNDNPQVAPNETSSF
jgi:hypothetical protein